MRPSALRRALKILHKRNEPTRVKLTQRGLKAPPPPPHLEGGRDRKIKKRSAPLFKLNNRPSLFVCLIFFFAGSFDELGTKLFSMMFTKRCSSTLFDERRCRRVGKHLPNVAVVAERGSARKIVSASRCCPRSRNDLVWGGGEGGCKFRFKSENKMLLRSEILLWEKLVHNIIKKY